MIFKKLFTFVKLNAESSYCSFVLSLMTDVFSTTAAITTAQLVANITKALHLGAGTNLPGRIARKISPAILKNLGEQLAGPNIAVTGTNGKTTTAGLIQQFLEAGGKSVLHNQLGANMLTGITAELVRQADLTGHLKHHGKPYEHAVLELDEASVRHVAAEVPIHQMVVTNLFRDQLDRYGELDTTARLIESAFDKTRLNQGGTLILNADDPRVASMGILANNVVYFGIENVNYTYDTALDFPVGFPREVVADPNTGGDLYFSKRFFGHLGHYEGIGCGGYDRPQTQITAKNVLVKPDVSLVTIGLPDGQTLELTLPLPGIFNVYNLLAAVAVASVNHVEMTLLQPALDHYTTVFGRAETKMINGKTVRIFLIKNPVGASEVLKAVCGDPNGRLMLALNDNDADGRDVSWIWDAEFERIARSPAGQKPIVISGQRAWDMAIRLKYAGCDSQQITVVENLETAVRQAVNQCPHDEILYLLPTYTALLKLNQLPLAN